MSSVRELVMAQLVDLGIDPTATCVLDELELLDRGVLAGQSTGTPTKQVAAYWAIGHALLNGQTKLIGIRNGKLVYMGT
jgi:hypothetical protein